VFVKYLAILTKKGQTYAYTYFWNCPTFFNLPKLSKAYLKQNKIILWRYKMVSVVTIL